MAMSPRVVVVIEQSHYIPYREANWNRSIRNLQLATL